MPATANRVSGGTRTRGAVATLAWITTLLATGCGGPPTAPDPERPTAIYTEPAAGAPGAVLSVVGIEAVAGATLEARVDGKPAPVLVSEGGSILIAIPLDAAGTDGVTPPSTPVDVEVLAGGATIGLGEGVLSVSAMPEAPGASRELQVEFATLAEDLGGILNVLYPEPSEAEAYALAVTDALTELLEGDDSRSLIGALDGLSAEEVAFLDRFVASSRILDRTRELASSFADVLAGLEKPANGPDGPVSDARAVATLTSDVSLARQMQFQVVASLFGETVVNETAQTYSETVGLAAGAAGLVAAIPGASVVSAIVAVIDFSVNKILLGLLPSEITAFTLTLEDETLSPGETTAAKVEITATNAPPAVGIQDFVGLTLNLLGLGGSSAPQGFRDVLLDTAAFFLSTIQQGLSSYASEYPELDLDVQFSIVPVMTWEAVIRDPRLVERLSLTPDVITGSANEVNWVAGGSTLGQGRIYARTAIGPAATLIDLPLGIEYTGGAFGESVEATDTRTVQVLGELVVEVDFATTIEADGINVLGVRAGYWSATGALLWTAGLQVALIVEGGLVQERSGVTDAEGRFSTLAQLLPDSDEIIITVTVSDDYGQNEDVTVEASGVRDASVTLLGGSYIYVEAGYTIDLYVPGTPGSNPRSIGDRVLDAREIDGPGTWTATAQAEGVLTHPTTGNLGSASGMASTVVGIQGAEGDRLLALSWGYQATAMATTSGTATENFSNAAGVLPGSRVRFAVVGGPVDYVLTSQFDGTPYFVGLLGEFEHLGRNGPIVAPQLSGTLEEGEYVIEITGAGCGAHTSAETSCTVSFQVDLVLTRPGG